MTRTDSRAGNVYGIFLHALALYGLLTVLYIYLGKPSWRQHVSELDAIDCIPIEESSSTRAVYHTSQKASTADGPGSTETRWTFNTARDNMNLGLSEEQCNVAFPKQYTDINNNVGVLTNKPIKPSDLDAQDHNDMRVRAMIYNGELYLISTSGGFWWSHNGVSTSSAIHRALSAYPDRKSLPNIEFMILLYDIPGDHSTVWSYTKTAHPTEFKNQWLMPDCGHWAWADARISSYNHIRNEMRRVEDQVAFEDKIPQLLWRGNVGTAPELRIPFVKSTQDKDWANVGAFLWENVDKDLSTPYIPLWDHCRYQMLMDIAGRAWSGKGKYIQNCESVYMTHQSLWLKPTTWAMTADGPDQNFVQVRADWSDVEGKVEELLNNTSLAKRIAKNSVETFRDRYLTPAAEACYWRALIRGYGRVTFEPDLYEDDNITLRGVPFETVAMQWKVDTEEWWKFDEDKR